MKGVKTNPELVDLISELRITSRERKEDVWRDVAERLERSRSQRAHVNVGKLNKVVGNNEIALVPGKVLGAGKIDKSISVAALSFSDSAYQKLLASGSEAMSIEELLKDEPDVRRIRIVG